MVCERSREDLLTRYNAVREKLPCRKMVGLEMSKIKSLLACIVRGVDERIIDGECLRIFQSNIDKVSTH